MSRRNRNRDQLDLFGNVATPVPVAATRPEPPARPRRNARSAAGNPAVAQDVLAEIEHGRYGLLDHADRVVLFEDTDHVRMALDEDAVWHFLTAGYAERCSPREAVSALHGAVRRPVLPLRLTKRGRTLLHRWSGLRPLGQ